MLRPPTLLLSLATLAATTLAVPGVRAQSAEPATEPTPSYLQAQPAPIERAPQAPPPQYGRPNYPPANVAASLTVGQPLTTTNGTATAQPTPGIWLTLGRYSSLQAVAIGPDRTELRLDRGLVNIHVHHPEHHAAILVDLPGGQAALLKDGLYTVNAGTHTVRVLKGEADAYPSANSTAKPVKIKEDHAVAFTGAPLHSFEFEPFMASSDLLPPAGGYARNGDGGGYYGGYPYGDGPYGDGFYGYPYYAYGYPYGWGYPFGWGYPGFDIGFGYYRGFGYGGFRGRR